jgi:hypothetical protein
MATDVIPSPLPDLSGLTLTQLAALPTIGEVLAHMNQDGTVSVPRKRRGFNSAI